MEAKYRSGEAVMIGDLIEIERCGGFQGMKQGMRFTVVAVDDVGDPTIHIEFPQPHTVWTLANRFRLIRRAASIADLDCTGIFEPAKPPKKIHRYPRRAQQMESVGPRYGYAEQLSEGAKWDCRHWDGREYLPGEWPAEAGETYIEKGTWIETFDHHTNPEAVEPEVTPGMRAAARECSDHSEFTGWGDMQEIIARHVGPELDELRNERDEAVKRANSLDKRLSAFLELALNTECIDLNELKIKPMGVFQ
jgi:hypothetical protein